MQKTMRSAIVMVALATTVALAQDPWPPEVSASPQNPGTSDRITLTISDTWSSDCVPKGVSSTEIRGQAIYVTLNQPLYLLCNRKATFWQTSCSVGPLAAGCYDVYVQLSVNSPHSYPTAKAATFCVGSSGQTPTAGTLYTVGADGVHRISLDGSVEHLLALHKDSYDLEIRDNCLYVTEKSRGGAIFVYTLAGDYIESIPTPAVASEYLNLVALPERRFALLDNHNDKAFFIDEDGKLLATTVLLSPADSWLQTLKGIVVGNRLILSHNGKRQVLAIDLTNYHASVFKDLSSISETLGDIAYAGEKYYIIAGGRSVFRFTESGAAALVGQVPESNATGICVIGNFAYVTVNAANKLYKMDLSTGAVSVLVSGLNYPRDIECVESTGGETVTCCGLKAGARVMLLRNTPPDSSGAPAVGLVAGTLGTVICCDYGESRRPLFVSWDGWTNGKRDSGTFCEVIPFVPYSGWWMSCDDIAPWSGGGESCQADFCQYEPFDAGLSPTSIQAGQSLYISFGVANCGTVNIPAGWRIRYYASVDPTITSSDYLLSESIGDFSIVAGQQLPLEEEFLFPSGVPAGSYYLGWVFDPGNDLCESNENNNAGYLRSTRLIVIGSSGGTCNADFCQHEITNPDLSPTTIQAGQSLYLAFGIGNCGTASIPAGWKIRYYASLDTTITSSDYVLYETTANPAIGAGVALSGTDDFLFPSGVPAGQYYIGWILDPDNQICESNESNNAGYLRGMRVTVIGSGGNPCNVDFCQYEITSASLSPTTIEAGQTLHLHLGIANCGLADIPAGWKIRYYASTDTTITSSDYFLYETVENPALGAGVAFSGTEDFTFPSSVPAGQYYIGWILDPDNQICESNESNNAGYLHGIRLTVGSQQHY